MPSAPLRWHFTIARRTTSSSAAMSIGCFTLSFTAHFTYNDQFARDTDYPFWDNSNSQYGLLGVWSGAETGIRVLPTFWSEVQKHWTDDQLPDGQWHYRSGDPEPRPLDDPRRYCFPVCCPGLP